MYDLSKAQFLMHYWYACWRVWRFRLTICVIEVHDALNGPLTSLRQTKKLNIMLPYE